MAEQQLSPHAGAAGEFKHTAGGPEGVERRNQLAAALPGNLVRGVVVLLGDSAVVRELFDEQRLEFIGSTWDAGNSRIVGVTPPWDVPGNARCRSRCPLRSG